MIDLKAFLVSIQNNLRDNLPEESQTDYQKKHEKYRHAQLKTHAFANSQFLPVGNKGYYFEYGNEFLESTLPQYHILEDSEIIKKRGQGTKTSKGSQDSISYSYRDYGQLKKSKSGKSVYQEYRKNIRGERNKAQHRKYKVVWDKKTGNRYFTDISSSYVNNRYHYIENILLKTLPFIAQDFGLTFTKTKQDNSILGNVEGMTTLSDMLSNVDDDYSW